MQIKVLYKMYITDDEVIQQQKAPIDADKGVVQNVYKMYMKVSEIYYGVVHK
jgi:hypothetical protein